MSNQRGLHNNVDASSSTEGGKKVVAQVLSSWQLLLAENDLLGDINLVELDEVTSEEPDEEFLVAESSDYDLGTSY